MSYRGANRALAWTKTPCYRWVMVRTWFVVLLSSATFAACVSAPKTNSVGVLGQYATISGNVTTVLVPGVTAPGYGNTFSVQFQDALTDPNEIFGHILNSGYITTGAGCTSEACPVQQANVRVDTTDSATNGIWTLAYAFPAANNPNWVIAASQALTPAQVSAAQEANSSSLTGIVTYALPTATLSAFASVSGFNATGDGSSLQGRGAVIGLTSSPNVTVSVKDSSVQIIYPNDGFTGTNASNTGATGMFLAVGPAITGSPDTAASHTTALTLTGTAGNANTWAAATLELVPGIIAIEAWAPEGK